MKYKKDSLRRRAEIFDQFVKKVDSNVFKDGVYRVKTFFENGKIDNTHLSDLPAEEQKALVAWVGYNFDLAKNFYLGATSYGFKHVYEYRAHIYVTNNQFKEAMLMNGFYPKDASELNWIFRIKKSSSVFKTFSDGKFGTPMLDRENLNEILGKVRNPLNDLDEFDFPLKDYF